MGGLPRRFHLSLFHIPSCPLIYDLRLYGDTATAVHGMSTPASTTTTTIKLSFRCRWRFFVCLSSFPCLSFVCFSSLSLGYRARCHLCRHLRCSRRCHGPRLWLALCRGWLWVWSAVAVVAKVKAHKTHLVARSEYFRSMFRKGAMRESETSEVGLVLCSWIFASI